MCSEQSWVGILLGSLLTWSATACGGQSASEDGTGGAGGTGGGSSSSGTGGQSGTGASPSDFRSCQTPSDCGWGEIDHEILAETDCVCLLGCPYLPLNQTTLDRRLQQYLSLCDPNVDGQGNPCPVDECMYPPDPTCEDQVCGPTDPFGR